MSILRTKVLWASLLGILLSGGLLLVVVGYLGLLVYSGVATGTSVVEILLNVALPFLVGTALLLGFLILSGVGFLWALAQSVSLPRSRYAGRVMSRLERRYPPLGSLGLAKRLTPPEPSPEERAERALARLKRRYVDGEISEAEFERKVDQLVTNESIDESRLARERRTMTNDESRRNG